MEKLWKEAMVDEMASLHKNEAWDLVELPARRKPIGSKWVFKKKTNAEGNVEKYKARLIAKGYSQVPGIDFGDIFSPVAKVTSIRITQSFSSQAIHLSIQSLTIAHRHNRQHICLPSVLEASYFLVYFLLGPLATTYVILPSHIALTSVVTAQS